MISQKLKDLRAKSGLTQEDVGRVIGGTKQTIHRLEHGSLPTIEQVKKLAAFFEVSTDYLLGLVEEPKGQLEPNDLTADERRFLIAIRGKAYQKVLEMVAALMGQSADDGAA